MSNMSESILRNLVASVFNIKATRVTLSGEIEATANWQNSYMDGSCGSNRDTYTIWGFNPQTGFVDISNIVGRNERSNYTHSNTINELGKELHTVENAESYIFFLINNNGYSHWSGSNQEEWDSWTLFKAPDFKNHWDKIEQEDIERWNNWLNE